MPLGQSIGPQSAKHPSGGGSGGKHSGVVQTLMQQAGSSQAQLAP